MSDEPVKHNAVTPDDFPEIASAVVLPEDARRLVAERVLAAERIVDAMEDEGDVILAAAQRGDAAGVAAAIVALGTSTLERMKAALAIPPEDLRAAIERAQRRRSQI